jgi:hypothetical protein
MRTSVRYCYLMSLLVSVFMLAGAVASPAIAQDKAKAAKGKPVTKVLFNDDKVRVAEVTFRPGDEAANGARPFHIVRALKGGTLMRTYADGTTAMSEYKTGEVKVLQAESKPYTPKNVGTSDLVLYIVFLKEPKK